MGPLGIRIEALLGDFRVDSQTFERQLNDAVMQDLIRRAIRVEAAAKSNATHRPGPNVITGRLRASIGYRPGADAQGPYVDVGTAVEYAPYVELGHGNTAHAYRKRDGTIGFVGNRRTPPYPFLLPALNAARTT